MIGDMGLLAWDSLSRFLPFRVATQSSTTSTSFKHIQRERERERERAFQLKPCRRIGKGMSLPLNRERGTRQGAPADERFSLLYLLCPKQREREREKGLREPKLNCVT